MANRNIKRIVLKHTAGAFSGGTGTPAWATDGNANSLLMWIKVYINSKEVLCWQGDSWSESAGIGVLMMRKFNELQNQVADVNEEYVIEFFNTIPASKTVRVEFYFNPIATIMDSSPADHTGYSGTIGIDVDDMPSAPANPQILWVFQDRRNIGTKTRDMWNITGIPDGMKALGILIFAEDNGTKLTLAEAVLVNLDIKLRGQQLFNAALDDLMKKTATRAKITYTQLQDATATDGCWGMLPLDGQNFKDGDLKVDARISTAQTDLDLHMAVLCVGAAP